MRSRRYPTNLHLVFRVAGQVARGQGGAACPGAVGDLGGGGRRRRGQGEPKVSRSVVIAVAFGPSEPKPKRGSAYPFFCCGALTFAVLFTPRTKTNLLIPMYYSKIL